MQQQLESGSQVFGLARQLSTSNQDPMSESATLYVIATPIGNLGDISERALQILHKVDLIAAEDTRHSKALLNHFGISTPLVSLYEHNEIARVAELITRLQNGDDIALISDAGTPLLSDPGYHLVKTAHENSITVSPIPGPSAITAALSAAGLPTDAFYFAGFPSTKQKSRRQQLLEFSKLGCTVVLFESTHRILDLLHDIVEQLGAEQKIVIARELSKRFETILSGRVSSLLEKLELDKDQQRGEFVVLLSFDKKPDDNEFELRQCLTVLLEELSVKQAAKLSAKLTGSSRKQAYDLALSLQKKI